MNIYPTFLRMLVPALCLAAASAAMADEAISEVPFSSVRVDDSFWSPRIETNRLVSIPSAFRQCEINGRFDNFAIAGGLMQGEHRGDFPFDDTDPYKIIEGASYSLAVTYDPALDAYLDSVIAVIASAQEPDGYLTTCVTNRCERLSGWWGTGRWQKINSHELYNSGHLIEAAVAHYRATGKRSLLDVAIRNADLICRDFGPAEGQKHVPSGHPIIEMAMAKLYRATGERRYLDAARYFVEETGRGTDGHALSPYSQDHCPILEQDEILGHAVRAGYLYSGVADVAALTPDPAYQAAIERIWRSMASGKLYITGGIGSRSWGEGFGPAYELHNQTAYAETCAAIANVYWNHRMFLATGASQYVDVLEQALYNGVISGVSLSGDRFFYDNPLESMGHDERQQWFGCACCPGNVTRFIASVPGYIYARRGGDVYVNLYIGGTADIDDGLTLTQATRYPYDGRVDITVDKAPKQNRTLRLRIPGWAKGQPLPGGLYEYADSASGAVTLALNGRPVPATVDADGYVTISRRWRRGDRLSLSLPMEARRVKADDRVADDRGKLAITRGPVVYCIEGVDQSGSTVFDKYLPATAALTETLMPDTLGGIVMLSATGFALAPDGSPAPAILRAIPYSVWCNRGPAQMAVWLPVDAEHARPEPAPSIASQAEMYTELAARDGVAATSNLQWAWGYNDQWDPASSSDTSKPFHYWWRRGTTENVCYRFAEPTTVSSVDVYWLEIDHYDMAFRAPDSWTLQYLDADGNWADMPTPTPYGTETDRYNHVSFAPVSTTALRLTACLRPSSAAGVLEWKVNP